MYCKNCGTEILGDAQICPKCSVPVYENTTQQNPYAQQGYGAPYTQQSYQQPQPGYQPAPYVNNESASTGLKVLCFLIPIVGIILYFVDRTNKPQSAKDCLKFALISIGVYAAFWLCCFIFIFFIAASAS